MIDLSFEKRVQTNNQTRIIILKFDILLFDAVN